MMKIKQIWAIANRQQKAGAVMPATGPVGKDSSSKGWISNNYWFYGLVGFFGISALGSITQILEDPAARDTRMIQEARQEQVRAIEGQQTEIEDARQTKEEAKLARLDACSDVESEAYIRTREAVRGHLKSPSTASFPWSAVLSKHTGDCKFEVLAYVDAQNGFGAVIRTAYAAALTYNPDTETWKLTSFTMDK